VSAQEGQGWIIVAGLFVTLYVVHAGESAKFQLPFIKLALVPESGSSFSVPAHVGHLRAAELFLPGEPFTATRPAELSLVTRVVPDQRLSATAMEAAQNLAAKQAAHWQRSSRNVRRISPERWVRDAGNQVDARVRTRKQDGRKRQWARIRV
jgi:enoyl-CoA hydratase/carnithine racemase